MNLTAEDVKQLVAEFPKDKLGVKIQTLNNRDRERATRAMLVLYLQHTDVMGRLDAVDPCWFNQVVHLQEIREGEKMVAVVLRMQLTVKGVTRENVGEGNDEKGAYSDALKRCAMMFGVGRYLYDSDQVWVPYVDKDDRYRAWTYADYSRAAVPQQNAVAPAQQSQAPRQAVVSPRPPAQSVPSQPLPVSNSGTATLPLVGNQPGPSYQDVLNYVVPFGEKMKDKRLSEVPVHTLRFMVKKYQDEWVNGGKRWPDKVLFVAVAEKFLEMNPGPQQPSLDDVPPPGDGDIRDELPADGTF